MSIGSTPAKRLRIIGTAVVASERTALLAGEYAAGAALAVPRATDGVNTPSWEPSDAP